MLSLLDEFLLRAGLPADASAFLRENYSALLSFYENDCSAFTDTVYSNGFNVGATEEMRVALAQKSGINVHTVNFVLLMYAAKRMRRDYEAAGLSDELFFDTIMDFKYKLIECFKKYDVYGIFVPGWYGIFYALELFKLGRLEFQTKRYDRDIPYVHGDIRVEKGDFVLSVHIPSSGPLTEEGRYDSYRRAYEFFEKQRAGKPLVCVCSSWLMYKGNREIFPEGMNIVRFQDDWDIIESTESEKFGDFWRIFGKDCTGDLSGIPENTSQQRALANWLRNGKKTGHGFAVMVFDGEKIINK